MADFVNSAFNIEVSLGEVAVKRKIKAQTKITTLNLLLLNNPQGTPKFARVSELGVCEGK